MLFNGTISNDYRISLGLEGRLVRRPDTRCKEVLALRAVQMQTGYLGVSATLNSALPYRVHRVFGPTALTPLQLGM